MEPAVIGLIASMFGVVFTMWRHQVIAQRRATVDFVISQKQDDRLIDAYSKVSTLIKSGQSFSDFCTKEDTDEYKSILLVLASFEIGAVGVRSGAYNEMLFQRMRHTAIVKTWNVLQGFINEERIKVDSKTLYQDFEWLAKRWTNSPLKSDW